MKNKIDKLTEFNILLDRLLSRRNFIKKGLFLGLSSFVMNTSCLTKYSYANSLYNLDFDPVEANSLDTVTLPKGYTWSKVVSWGDPIFPNLEEFNQETRGTSKTQILSFGDNNDGMELFTNKNISVLVVNNEYTNKNIIFGNRKNKTPENSDDIKKSKAAHGISIVEIYAENKKWKINRDSLLNRRITADSKIDITGYAKGSKFLKTKFDAKGILSLGTWNNCGNGKTPWGTYLACEENFNAYFSSSKENLKLSKEFIRYGIKHKDWGYNWASIDERFDIFKHPNEPNRCGYVIEIDPFNPDKKPRKLTSLGRFKHENAEVVLSKDRRVVVYMGDDERGEFLYKYVSNNKYVEGDDASRLLEEGSLFVAKFYDNLKGEWLELTSSTTGFKNKAEICIFTRIAASNVGATTMDRPEWVASNPLKCEVYCALTNNKNRGLKKNMGGDPMIEGGPNPRKNNIYGQIVRWVPDNEDHANKNFRWDLFAMAGNPEIYKNLNAGSKNIRKDNMFNAPDGLRFDSNGLLWIQTDGNYSNVNEFKGMGNNQMLVANTFTGEIKRFMVGPKECEVTGLTWSEDKKTMFVGIQHPGEKGNGHFPDGDNKVPRSSVIAIYREDS